MAAVYANLIIKGVKSLDGVPQKLKEDVLKILKDRGWTEEAND